MDSWDSTVQPWTVLKIFSDTISGFAATSAMLFGTLLHMAGAVGLSSFLLAFLRISLYSSSSKSIKEDSAQSSSIVELWFLFVPIPAFLDSERLYLFSSKLLAIHDLVVACIFVSLSPDHIYPFGGFSFNKVNLVKPLHESDKFLFESTFQQSSIRFSCNTSRSV